MARRGSCSARSSRALAASARNAPTLPYSRAPPAAGVCGVSHTLLRRPMLEKSIFGRDHIGRVCRDLRPQQYHLSSSVLTLRTPIRSYAVIGRMGLGVPAGNGMLPVTHTRGELLFWDNRMREYNEYVARAAVCEQRAKEARTESEKQSWLVMADSWRETVKLQEMLTRHAEVIRKVPMLRASGA
jgi:hypothetical protein